MGTSHHDPLATADDPIGELLDGEVAVVGRRARSRVLGVLGKMCAVSGLGGGLVLSISAKTLMSSLIGLAVCWCLYTIATAVGIHSQLRNPQRPWITVGSVFGWLVLLSAVYASWNTAQVWVTT